jgi:hypothetical protein
MALAEESGPLDRRRIELGIVRRGIRTGPNQALDQIDLTGAGSAVQRCSTLGRDGDTRLDECRHHLPARVHGSRPHELARGSGVDIADLVDEGRITAHRPLGQWIRVERVLPTPQVAQERDLGAVMDELVEHVQDVSRPAAIGVAPADRADQLAEARLGDERKVGYGSVTAPRSAPCTRRANLASTPVV